MRGALEEVLALQPEWSKDNTPAMQRRGELIRNVIPAWVLAYSDSVAAAMGISANDLIVEGRDGVGKKATVPWVRIADRRTSPSATVGWYVVMLFAQDGEAAYLCLARSAAMSDGKLVPTEAVFESVNSAKGWMSSRSPTRSDLIESIDLASTSPLGKSYEQSVACAIRYPRLSLPSEELLLADLKFFADLLREWTEHERSTMSSLEQKLSDIVEATTAAGASGYAWAEADALMLENGAPETGAKSLTRFKQASTSSRAANVLKESPQQTASIYFVIIGREYSLDAFRPVALADMNRASTPCEAVAVIEWVPEVVAWRVTDFIARSRGSVSQYLEEHFPLTRGRGSILQNQTATAMPGPREPISGAQYAEIPGRFVQFCDELGVLLSQTRAVDLLACAFSSQSVMFVGASGTGKSLIASVLADFLAPRDRIGRIEARRSWGSPEDISGYYSPLTDSIVAANHSSALDVVSAHAVSANLAPILVVEEANLSPIEGYLTPIMHGLGGMGAERIAWPGVGPDRQSSPPAGRDLGPFLRVFKTINVDATAPAPAPKIVARSMVVVMDPPEHADLQDRDWKGALRPLEREGSGSLAHGFIWDPRDAVELFPSIDIGAVAQGVLKELEDLGLSGHVSLRSIERMVLYCLWYVLLSGDSDTGPKIRVRAIRNALLHSVLPTLSPVVFRSVIGLITSTQEGREAEVEDDLLHSSARRLSRAVADAGHFTSLVDFWASLS